MPKFQYFEPRKDKRVVQSPCLSYREVCDLAGRDMRLLFAREDAPKYVSKHNSATKPGNSYYRKNEVQVWLKKLKDEGVL